MMNCESTPQGRLKGWHTYYGSESLGYGAMMPGSVSGYEAAMPQYDSQSNRWASTENNQNNAWNSNFNNGNIWNNNKYNSTRVRPVVAYDTPKDFLLLVLDAFEDCCRHKTTSAECIAYCEIADEDLPVLAHELYAMTYKPGVSTCFLVKYPKYREVFAACFRDRIVHHFLYLLLNPLFEEKFVRQGNVSFNCRAGYGNIAAQKAAFEAIRECTGSYRKGAWVYRGDIVSFFMSIDKRILWKKLKHFISGEYNGGYMQQVMFVTETIVFHCPEKNCVFNTEVREWREHITREKSLFGNGAFFGMPIGNLTTQIFANFIMSFFDEFVNRWFSRSGVKPYYLRFVDDFLVVCRSRAMLKKFIKDADVFLRHELSLSLHHDKYHFQKASHGVLFVGAYMKNGRVYLSCRTLARFAERINGFRAMLNDKTVITISDVLRIEQVLNSYLGFCKGKRTYRYRKELLMQMSVHIFRYFYIRGHYETVHVKRKYKIAV